MTRAPHFVIEVITRTNKHLARIPVGNTSLLTARIFLLLVWSGYLNLA